MNPGPCPCRSSCITAVALPGAQPTIVLYGHIYFYFNFLQFRNGWEKKEYFMTHEIQIPRSINKVSLEGSQTIRLHLWLLALYSSRGQRSSRTCSCRAERVGCQTLSSKTWWIPGCRTRAESPCQASRALQGWPLHLFCLPLSRYQIIPHFFQFFLLGTLAHPSSQQAAHQ